MRECVSMSGGPSSPAKSRRKLPGNQGSDVGLSRPAAVPSAFKTVGEAECGREAPAFVRWLCRLLDEERTRLPAVLAQEASLEWFGRSVRSRRKVAGFLQCEVNSTRHHFATVDACPPFVVRADKPKRAPAAEDEALALPLAGGRTPARLLSGLSLGSPCKRPPRPVSPAAAGPPKKARKAPPSGDEWGGCSETPPGARRPPADRCPSADDDAPRFYVEASGYVEFSRTRNHRKGEAKWERKCRLRVCYSANRPRADDYIVHSIVYSDETKCRRNLLPEFEEVARQADRRAK